MFADFLEIINGQLHRSGITPTQYARWLGISLPAVLHVLKGPGGISFQRAEYFGKVLGLRLRIFAEEIAE